VRALIHADLQRTLFHLTRFRASLQAGRRALALEDGMTPEEAMEVHVWMSAAHGEIGELEQARAEIAAADALRVKAHLENTRVGMLYWQYRSFTQADAYELENARASMQKARAIADAASGVSIAEREQIEFQIADSERMLGNFATAENILRPLLAREVARLGARHPLPCMTSLLLAVVLGYEERVKAAIPIARDARTCLEDTLGPQDDHTLSAMDMLAGLHFQDTDWRAASQVWTEELHRRQALVGEESFKLVMLRSNIARCKARIGDFPAAEAMLRVALDAARKAYPDANPIVQGVRFNLADVLLAQRRTGEVDELLDGLDPAALGKAAIANDWDARLQLAHGRLALLRGDFARAREDLSRAQRLMQDRGGDDRYPDAVVQGLVDAAQAGRLPAVGAAT
jgi:tetratricopeptide (TPR) repeat protein